jgi:hypothetical protein
MHVLESRATLCVAAMFTLGACAEEAAPRGGPVARAEPEPSECSDADDDSTGIIPDGSTSTSTAADESTGSATFTADGSGDTSSGLSTGGDNSTLNCECQCRLAGQRYYVSGVTNGQCSGQLFRYAVADAAACTALNGTQCRGSDGQNAWTYYGSRCARGLLTATHHSCTFSP